MTEPANEPADKEVGTVMEESSQPPLSRNRRDPDFSRAVLEDLYRYPEKSRVLALVLWLATGLLGGHRFYLDRTVTGFAMLFTGGGAAIWWVVDLFLVTGMVAEYNRDQEARKQNGLPPKALAFMPPLDGQPLPEKPDWADKRSGGSQLAGGAIVLFLAGTGLGAVSSATGNVEAIVAVLALIAITLLGARWDALATMPVLRSFDRWNHRLRLYYFTTDPGGPLSLALRPIVGVFIAPWRMRARAEVRLYLQLGAWFTILFAVQDVFEASGSGPFGINVGLLIADLAQTLVSVYAFAAPIGAILTTQLLLSRSDKVIWGLSGIGILAILFGSVAAGS